MATQPFLAEIRIFAGNFPPRGWALCDGQLMSISQATALFSLLGTTYGGDGKSNFGLPNLMGSSVMQQGQGPGLSLRDLGEIVGEATVSLLETEIPAHRHTYMGGASTGRGGLKTVPGNFNSDAPFQTNIYSTSTDNTQMNPIMIQPTAASQPHENMQPYLGLTFIIALQGVFPARS
jgi:microcystin-dependent protein